MKIGIDARFLTHPQPGGFKTYTENLIAGLAEVDQQSQYILYVDRPPDQSVRLPKRPNFQTQVVAGTLPLIGMPWREQMGLARQAKRDKVDLLHSPSLTAPLRLACRSVVTIHDTIWLFPERFSNGKSSGKRNLMRWYYNLVPRAAARSAAAVITVSGDAKQSITSHLHLRPERIFVTHEAASTIYRRISDPAPLTAIRTKYDLGPEFILAISSADPRKNITTLLKAFAQLPEALRARYQLAVVWTHKLLAPEIMALADSLGISGQLRFLERVSNDDLVLLYNAASLFVFPSLYEGFGLPLLEAMACGTPVVAANNSSIPEIVGDAAVLVDAQQANGMAQAIGRVLEDKALHADLIRRGIARAGGFSWARCAQETVAVYQKATGS